MGNIDNTDVVYFLDADSGREIWRHLYGGPKKPKNYEDGPNATGTISSERVYAVSKTAKSYLHVFGRLKDAKLTVPVVEDAVFQSGQAARFMGEC